MIYWYREKFKFDIAVEYKCFKSFFIFKIKIKIPINEIDSDNEEKRSKKSDSSNSLMDFDVVCDPENVD